MNRNIVKIGMTFENYIEYANTLAAKYLKPGELSIEPLVMEVGFANPTRTYEDILSHVIDMIAHDAIYESNFFINKGSECTSMH